MRAPIRFALRSLVLVAALALAAPAALAEPTSQQQQQARLAELSRQLDQLGDQLARSARLVSTAKRSIQVGPNLVMFNERTYEKPCGDNLCLIRATPGLSGGTDFPVYATWRLRTYRWVSTATYTGWQLSTSQTVTCNECSMNRDFPLQEWNYYGSVPNTYDVTWTEPNGHTVSGELWWSSMDRMSWRDWRGLAHYWPCQTCGDLTTVNSAGYYS